jgi:hypothetical protein
MTKKEGLAIIFVFKKFSFYLLRNKVIIVRDNQELDVIDARI